MKILKEGKIPVPQLRIFRGKCTKCGCEVECNESEATHVGERHPGGKSEWSIQCPTCQYLIILNEVVLRQDGPLKATMSDINKTLARVEVTPIKDVHTEHCCVRHGCKYGYEDCCVVTKQQPQSFICERCEDDGIHDMPDLKWVLAGITQTCPYCCHTLP